MEDLKKQLEAFVIFYVSHVSKTPRVCLFVQALKEGQEQLQKAKEEAARSGPKGYL